jgi:RNA polymerase sigma factor (sigma-70 family)
MLNKKILEGLFRQHYSEMFHLARTLLGADDEAEDVVQDVFARLMETDIIPEAEGIRAYLMSAVHHGCTNIIRRTAMRQQVESLYPVDGTTDLQPIDQMTEQLDAIQAYANDLTEPHRSIFHLRFDEGLTLKEIAQRLGMNQNTVYKYLRQSIQQIRLKLHH